jgi:hypothetical protein
MKVFSRGGVGVYSDYRENIIVDPNHLVLRWKAEKERVSPQSFDQGVASQFPQGLSRIASCHSEDALSWNVFRSLEKAWKLDVFTRLLGFLVVLETSSFWNRRDGPAVPQDTQAVLNCMEPWGKNGKLQQTETDVMLRGGDHVVLVESKLGKPGAKIRAWVRSGPDRPMRHEYRQFIECLESRGVRLFNDSFEFEKDGWRFHQLFRNYLFGAGLALEWNVGFSLVTVVNSMNRNLGGRSHEEEFLAFKAKLTRPSNTFLVTWQDLRGAIASEPSLALLHLYLSCYALLNPI